jgi:hypothetical protein
LIYPTNAHERAGKPAALPADEVDALLSGQSASFSNKREHDRAVEALGLRAYPT